MFLFRSKGGEPAFFLLFQVQACVLEARWLYSRLILAGPDVLGRLTWEVAMKVRNSLRSAKTRDKNCQIVRRKGRIYLINKKNPRFKARQG